MLRLNRFPCARPIALALLLASSMPSQALSASVSLNSSTNDDCQWLTPQNLSDYDAYHLRISKGALIRKKTPYSVVFSGSGFNKFDRRHLDSIVKIRTQGSSGTGTIVASEDYSAKILTSKHVVKSNLEKDLLVETGVGDQYFVESIDVFQDSDLAELTIRKKPSQCLKTVPLAPSLFYDHRTEKDLSYLESRWGNGVHIVGYPEASDVPKIVQADGLIQGSSNNSRSGGYSVMYFYKSGMHTEVGMSGSPVFNPKGFVVGIHGQVDTLAPKKNKIVRTGYGLAVPTQIWIEKLVGSTASSFSDQSANEVVRGTYLLSTGDYANSIESLSKAIKQSIVKHRQSLITRQNYFASIRETPEDSCKSSVEFETSDPYGMSRVKYTMKDKKRKYDFCLESIKADRRRQKNRMIKLQTNDDATEADMSYQPHLYALRALAYSAAGLVYESNSDISRCLKISGSMSSSELASYHKHMQALYKKMPNSPIYQPANKVHKRAIPCFSAAALIEEHIQ